MLSNYQMTSCAILKAFDSVAPSPSLHKPAASSPMAAFLMSDRSSAFSREQHPHHRAIPTLTPERGMQTQPSVPPQIFTQDDIDEYNRCTTQSSKTLNYFIRYSDSPSSPGQILKTCRVSDDFTHDALSENAPSLTLVSHQCFSFPDH